jgi:hypothetical protein
MIFDKIKGLVESLNNRFETNVSYGKSVYDFHYPTSEEVMAIDVRKMFDEIYKVHSGFNLVWKFDEQIFGEVNLLQMLFIFATNAQEHYIQIYDEWGEEFKKFARQFWPLDIYEESLDAVTLTVVKIIDEEHLELWIWNNAGPKYKLKFNSIEEYLEAGVKCKFIVCWQYFYIDTEALDFNDPFTNEWIASDFNGAMSRMKTALASMKEYFPEEDWSYQEGELERVKLLEKR